MKNFTKIILLILTCCSLHAYSLPKLNSLPSATATVYLDFDGHTVTSSVWNGGNPIFCASPGLTDDQITEIFNRVSEDYRPFNINITTDSTKFLAAPLTQRVRVIITPTSSWKPNVGGISYIGSFTWGDDTPAFVFSDKLGPNNPKYVAECCSHESGHALGLSHQSSYDNNCNLVETYNTGSGSGETGWAPVMGNSYYKNMTGWNDGPTPYGCANVQDNLTIITSQNGFSYRTDDYTETLDGSTYSLGNNSFTVDGLVATSTDKDAFRFVATQNSHFHMEATPNSLGGNNVGANLDIKILLYDATKTLIRTYDPISVMSVTIDTSLNAGTYYFVLDGSGNLYSSNYGSLGAYRMTGFMGALPIRNVSLSGSIENNKHKLNWDILSDDPILSQNLEVSADGINFNPLTTVSNSNKIFNYDPHNNNTLYYRLMVTSVLNQTVYSNIVALKSDGKSTKAFTVSNLIQQQIRVTATDAYQYRLMDSNGRLLATGNGFKGSNNINMDRFPGGMYLLQLYNNNEQQSERIIKQ